MRSLWSADDDDAVHRIVVSERAAVWQSRYPRDEIADLIRDMHQREGASLSIEEVADIIIEAINDPELRSHQQIASRMRDDICAAVDRKVPPPVEPPHLRFGKYRRRSANRRSW